MLCSTRRWSGRLGFWATAGTAVRKAVGPVSVSWGRGGRQVSLGICHFGAMPG